MEEITCNKTYQEHTLIKVLGITSLTILIFAGVAGAAPFAYVTTMGDYDQKGHYYDMNYNGTVPTPNVAVIDTATDNVIATVPVGTSSRKIVISPDGNKVYLGNFYNKSVTVINTETNTVTATVPVGEWPMGIAVTPDGKRYMW